MFKIQTLGHLLSNLPQRGREIRHQGSNAKIWVRQFAPFAGADAKPENWFVPQTTPWPAMIGLGSGVASE